MKLVILDARTFGDEVDLSILTRGFEDVSSFPNTRAHDTLARIEGARVVVTNKVVLTEAIMEKTPTLQFIAVAATGTNNVDLEAAHRLGIKVANVPDYAPASVAAHTFALYFNLAHHLAYHNAFCHDGGWSRSELFTHLDRPWNEPQDQVWGIVGMGKTGSIVARQAACFGFQVVYHSTSGANLTHPWPHLPLDQLLKRADVVSLHAALKPSTHHLIGPRELAIMKNNALLLNTSRGQLIDEDALARALEVGAIAGAGLDVLQTEPPDPNNPLFRLSQPQRLIVTPHIAGLSTQARTRLVAEVRSNIDAFLDGNPRNLCKP